MKSRLEKMEGVKKYKVLRLTLNQLTKHVNEAFYEITGVRARVSLEAVPPCYVEAIISPEELTESEEEKIKKARFRVGECYFIEKRVYAEKLLDYLLGHSEYFVEVVKDTESIDKNEYIINIFIKREE